MRFKLLAAALMGAAITVPAGAFAATVVEPTLGTISGFKAFGTALNDGVAADSSLNTFIFTFSTTKTWNALFAMQAQEFPAIGEDVQFELDKWDGATSTWVQVSQSDNVIGAVIPPGGGDLSLAAGDYRLVTDLIGVPSDTRGSLDGSITLFATGVPEPATWAMLILGVGLIGVVARRKAGLALAA